MIEVPKKYGGKEVKRNRILTVSLLCILLASILMSIWALARVSLAYQYVTQFPGLRVEKPSGAEGTDLTLMLYGDPAGARQVFDAFQYFTSENLEWRGAFPNPQGPPVDIALSFEYAKFEKLNPDLYVLNVTNLHIEEFIGDLLNLRIQAEDADAQIEFWTLNELPAVNMTAVLTENVEVSLSASILPLPGLWGALYEYKGDRFVISVCAVKPIEVNIEAPHQGDWVNNDVIIQASVKTAPGIKVENVWWWIEREGWGWQPMRYNKENGLWEAVWRSYDTGNGGCRLVVRAEGVEINKSGGLRQADEKRIDIEINNPWVNSFVLKNGGWLEGFGGLMVNLQHGQKSWQRGTGFNFPPWIDLSLTAPEYWWDGKIKFDCWRIDEEYGNTIFKSGDPTLTITDDISRMLFDEEGRARELKCVYVPAQP